MSNEKKSPWSGRAFLSNEDMVDVDAVAASIDVYDYTSGRSLDLSFSLTLSGQTLFTCFDISEEGQQDLRKLEKLRDFLSLLLREVAEVKKEYFDDGNEKEEEDI